MKKNISINISGIIFHIEEDGYDTLRKYLDSVNRYFSSFEDSGEIMADIESRIAEILLSKLNEGKQVITLEDINALIATMGSVRDFQAAEEREIPGEEPRTETGSGNTYQQSQQSAAAPKYLQRDMKRKILGGVCAGLGNYFNVDAVWIRLLFALLIIFTGVFLVVYIILWIAVPASWDLDEPHTGKKMFRDPERKVLGGVAAGVAAYFGIDIAMVRILFVVSLFAGFIGFFIYIALWVVLPEAHTITDRIQMEGEPVTLSNIESTIKKNLNEKETGEESALTKIILFPFRLIAVLINGLAKVIGPLADVLRVVIGVFITLSGLMLFLGALTIAGIVFGLFTVPGWWVDYDEMTIPIEAFVNLVPGWTIIPGLMLIIIPCIIIILLGSSVMAQRLTFNATFGWSLFILFFISAILVSIGIPKIAYSFREDGQYRTEKIYELKGGAAVFRVNEVGMDDYDGVSMTLIGYEGNNIRLEQIFKAQGSSRAKAIENAKGVEYHVTAEDSVITFDSNITFSEGSVFRGQSLKMLLYIPYGYPFTMQDGFSDLTQHYVDDDYVHGYTWIMTREGLKCNNCPEETTRETSYNSHAGGEDLTDFTEIDLNGGRYEVYIKKGSDFGVEVSGPESEKQNYNYYRSGETLVFDYDGIEKFDWDNWDTDDLKELARIEEVKITITMPDLERIEAIGSGTVRFDKFVTSDFELSAQGLLKISGAVEANYLEVELSSKAEATLSGSANTLNADVKYVSTLDAYGLKVNEAVVEATAASKAKVFVTQSLEMNENLGSDIDFKGNPKVVRSE